MSRREKLKKINKSLNNLKELTLLKNKDFQSLISNSRDYSKLDDDSKMVDNKYSTKYDISKIPEEPTQIQDLQKENEILKDEILNLKKK